jgi:hypothetical protein
MRRNDDEMQRRSVRQEHGPGDFYYSMLPDMRPHPVMRCLCGAFQEDICDSWEQAGKWLDDHILSALKKDDLRYHELLRKNGPAERPGVSPAAAGRK